MSKVTLNDIAARLNISQNAVSLALRGKPGISEQLRQRIIETAQEMNYPRLPSQSKRPNTSNILALVPGRLSVRTANSFYAQLCFYMEAKAKTLGYNLVITSVDPEEEAACLPPSIMDSIDFFAILAIGNLSKQYVRMLAALELKIVCVDQYYPDLSLHSVTSANTSGSYILTRHLIDMGHKKIAFMGQPSFTASLNDRWMGYCTAMAESGLPVYENQYQHARGVQTMAAALDEMKVFPTAFVCGNDFIAAQLMEMLNERGLNVPQDVSVVGFDDLEIPSVIPCNLTTYHTRKAEMAQFALDSILHYQEHSPHRISIYGYPVFRSSVRNLNDEQE